VTRGISPGTINQTLPKSAASIGIPRKDQLHKLCAAVLEIIFFLKFFIYLLFYLFFQFVALKSKAHAIWLTAGQIMCA